MSKPILRALLGVVLALGLAQLIPYGHQHDNPAHVREPSWANSQTRDLVHRGCFNCHSNQTHWPWYSNVAPVSWLVARDVYAARKKLNFSEWNRPQKHARDTIDEVRDGEMPPWFYTVMHPEAQLTLVERNALIAGFTKTFEDAPH